MHVFIYIYFQVMKNITYIEKSLEFDTVILIFTKGYSILYNEKGGVLLGLKISDVGWKVFFFRPESAKSFF